jgi:hypothetical protein
MVVVFLSSLVMAGFVQANRMDALDWSRLKEGSILFVPFLVMVALKFGLVVAARSRRSASSDPTTRDETLP